jgi:tetratricopeptide (TPR) repeat protein
MKRSFPGIAATFCLVLTLAILGATRGLSTRSISVQNSGPIGDTASRSLRDDGLPASLIGSARGLLAQGKTGEARGVLENALARGEDVEILVLLGVILEREGAVNEAEKRFQRALELDPENPEALLERGRFALSARRLDEAIEFLERAVAASPDSLDPVYDLGWAYRLKGADAKAKQLENRAHQLRLVTPPRGGMGEG